MFPLQAPRNSAPAPGRLSNQTAPLLHPTRTHALNQAAQPSTSGAAPDAQQQQQQQQEPAQQEPQQQQPQAQLGAAEAACSSSPPSPDVAPKGQDSGAAEGEEDGKAAQSKDLSEWPGQARRARMARGTLMRPTASNGRAFADGNMRPAFAGCSSQLHAPAARGKLAGAAELTAATFEPRTIILPLPLTPLPQSPTPAAAPTWRTTAGRRRCPRSRWWCRCRRAPRAACWTWPSGARSCALASRGSRPSST